MMNKRITITILIIILLAGFAFTTYGAPNEPDSLTLRWDVIGGGGGALLFDQLHCQHHHRSTGCWPFGRHHDVFRRRLLVGDSLGLYRRDIPPIDPTLMEK